MGEETYQAVIQTNEQLDIQIRAEALKLAHMMRREDDQANDVVKEAEVFYQFIKGA